MTDQREERRRIARMGKVARLLVEMPPEDRWWVGQRVRSDLAKREALKYAARKWPEGTQEPSFEESGVVGPIDDGGP